MKLPKQNFLFPLIMLVGSLVTSKVWVQSFDFPQSHPICVDPLWIEITDRDHNGKNDLLAVRGYQLNRAEIGLAFGDGRSEFTSCSSFIQDRPLSLTGGPEGVLFADFAEDGASDVLVVDGSGPTKGLSRLLLFASDPQELFSPAVEVEGAIERRAGLFPMAAGDLDSDGHLDFIIGNSKIRERYLRVERGDGTGNFEFAGEFTFRGSFFPEDIEIADFNQDGFLDVAVLLGDFQKAGKIQIFKGDGLVTPLEGWQAYWEVNFARTPYLTKMKYGDLTGDGILDLVLVSGRELDGELAGIVYPGFGNGTFADAPIHYPVGFPQGGLVIADFDEDGKNDLLIFGEVVFQVILSSENFQTENPRRYFWRVNAAPLEVETADFDGDSHLDLIMPDTGVSSVLVIPGLGDGRFKTVNWSSQECGQHYDAGFGDFNEDGVDDLVTSKNYSPDPLSVSLGPCVLVGRLQTPFFELLSSYSPSPSNVIDGRIGCIADFNSDEHLDIAQGGCVESGKTGFVIRFGNGDGTLLEPKFYEHPSDFCVEPIVSEDFNDDGAPDLLLADRRNGQAALNIYLGNGDGTFAPTWRQLWEFQDQQIVDFDKDGHMDIIGVIRVFDQRAVWLLKGLGDGRFNSIRLLHDQDFGDGIPYGLKVNDFNNDGRPDLVINWSEVNWSSTDARLFMTSPEGGFETPSIIPIPGVWLTGDVNGDGNVDIVTGLGDGERIGEGIYGPGTAAVAYGFGDGRFTKPQLIAKTYGAVYLRDVNRDGLPDFVLIGGGWTSPGLEVILQDQPFLLPTSFLRGDSNNDSRVDLSDAIFILMSLYLGATKLTCEDAADANDDGQLDQSDAITVLLYLFLGNPSHIPAPYPLCGEDPTDDNLKICDYQGLCGSPQN